MKTLYLITASALLIACQPNTNTDAGTPDEQPPTASAVDADARLAAVLAGMPDDVKARYPSRHPQETLMFFGIEPGMTVLEGLPGGGWYTRVLLPFLGEEGHVVGAAYALDAYALFSFANEEFMARQRAWAEKFPLDAAEWGGASGASATAFHFGTMPDSVAGTADAALMVRALHNLARFQDEGQGNYLDIALADVHRALKPGGILGIVQHEAQPDMPDDWANGASGYLKKQFVIDAVEAAGFEFVADSAVNQNPKDRPTTNDVVWRLPPAYNGTRDDPTLKAAVDAIGESNRMTLRFVKPE